MPITHQAMSDEESLSASAIATSAVRAPPRHPLFGSLVRLFLQNSDVVVGAGFLAGESRIFTCAHVVNASLGFDEESEERPSPGELVTLDFPYLRSPHIQANVEEWYPIGDARHEDIALLSLMGAAPDRSQPAPLVSGRRSTTHGFLVCGFPAGNDAGAWAKGIYVGERADGTVQLEGSNPTGYRIQPGFSGAPVWDSHLQRVTGMVVLSERRPELKVAFMIPTEVLISASNQRLKVHAQPAVEETHPDDFFTRPRPPWIRWIRSRFEDR